MSKEIIKPQKIISRQNREIFLYLQIFQTGVAQISKRVRIDRQFKKDISIGSKKENDIYIPYAKIPSSINLFRVGGKSASALLDQRVEGFLHTGEKFGDIKDFIAPKGSLGYLCEINSPLAVPLQLGSRGRLKIHGYDIAFKVEESRPKAQIPKELAVEPSLFQMPEVDLGIERYSPIISFFFALIAFVPLLYWLFYSPQKLNFGIEYLPKKIALQIIHPDNLRLLPHTFGKNFDANNITQQAIIAVEELQKRWSSAEKQERYQSLLPPLIYTPPILETQDFETPWKQSRKEAYDALENYRVSVSSPRYYSFLSPYSTLTTTVGGKNWGSNNIMLEKRLRQLKKFDNATKSYLKMDHDFMKNFLATFSITKAGIVDPPLTNRLLGAQPDPNYHTEFARYFESEYQANIAEKSKFRKFLQGLLDKEKDAVSIDNIWLSQDNLAIPVLRATPTAFNPMENRQDVLNLFTNAKYALGILKIPDLPKPPAYIDKKMVEFVIYNHRMELKACFESALRRNPHLSGTIIWEWDINLKGQVENLRHISSTLQDQGMLGCGESRIKVWNFPKPVNGSVTIKYPFRFTITD